MGGFPFGTTIVLHWVRSNFRQSDQRVSNLLSPANEVWGKVIFREVCVKNSVHRGGGSASVHAGIHPPSGPGTPPEQTPPGPGNPQDQASPRTMQPPREQTPPSPREQAPPPPPPAVSDTANKRAVYILLECNLVVTDFGHKNLQIEYCSEKLN